MVCSLSINIFVLSLQCSCFYLFSVLLYWLLSLNLIFLFRKTMRGGYVVEVQNRVQVTKLISTSIFPEIDEAVDCLLSSTKIPHPLCHAMKKGNLEIIELFIDSGADVRSPFGDFLPMFFALDNKDCQVEIVKLVIDAGFPKDAIINRTTQETSLHLAVSMNHICVVKYLLSISADINVIDIKGLSPLHIAVKKGNSAMIDLLIRHGEANLNCESKDGYTPMFFAIACGNCEIVELLISLGADIHYANSSKKHISMMPLHFGALMGQLKVTQLLLEKGAEVNKQNPKTGEIALHAAARANTFIDERSRISLSCITEILIRLGSNLKTRQKDGLTPLQVAVKSNNPIVTKLLIINGSELNDIIAHNGDKGLTTTTFHIISKMFPKEIIELAIEYGADVLKTNEDGLYPCHFVLMASLMHVISHKVVCTRDKSQCNFDDLSIYKLFWKHGFPYDLTLKMKWVNSCEPPFPPSLLALVQKQKLLFSGVKHQKVRLVEKALSQGAEVHCCSTGIPFPLHYIASKGNDIILKSFLSRGVKVNYLDKRGNSPLHLAARAGSTICCQMLMEYGAMYNYTSSDCSKTPMEVAKEKGHCEVVALLESVDNIFKGLKRNNFDQLVKPDMGILLAVMNCCDLDGLTLMGKALKYGLNKKAAYLLNLRIKLTCEEKDC